ncbi:hypothetical protein LCI18_006340 [Fusarium solani-melongenae]|uniref:Uncharacterized protein n=1 Tax=Fusarium solani subsp. cucurbitae TaxID=2747967 RepID=A0ACD3Z2H1_FUSSC|nr:hypothetical protein LCI18_006340 [Fusarium solani-melongenae]
MASTDSSTKQSVLITGCSEGGIGAALAVAFHNAGLNVYATARDPAKMKHLVSLGIRTLTLDVQSETSIAECVKQVPALDILVNNAGTQYVMPLLDIDIAAAKKAYDVNVWSHIAVTQAFLPLLLKSSNAMVVNQTSLAAVATVPFQGVYNSSKAAMAMLSDTLRLELKPFGIRVVDLRTGVVKSNLIQNGLLRKPPILPEDSIYKPARDILEAAMRQEGYEGQGLESQDWADAVVRDLLKKNPPPVIWRGEMTWLVWLGTFLPVGWLDGTAKRLAGLDKAEEAVRRANK